MSGQTKRQDGITAIDLKVKDIKAEADPDGLKYQVTVTQMIEIMVKAGSLEADILAIVAGNGELTLEAVKSELKAFFS